jgi:peptidoglycan/xylan/chitin deacetylase (PgdA/CDA1 family)
VLTFDDGPYRDHTPRVLDALAARHLSASFFVVGRHITRHTFAIVQRMEKDGHTIASHSYDHDIHMATHYGKDEAIAYIQGQHEVTRILIEMALLATSGADFDAMHEAVFDVQSDKRIGVSELRDAWPTYLERHEQLRTARGFVGERYRVVFSRPPGGGPYLGRAAEPRRRYDAALQALGMTNVMWHRQSGDVHPTRGRDRAALIDNIVRAGERGGILLIHDFIRHDALLQALDRLVAGDVTVTPLEQALLRKAGCPTST